MRALAVGMAVSLIANQGLAQTIGDVLVRSDVPFWPIWPDVNDDERISPRGDVDAEGSGMVALSDVAVGTWRLRDLRCVREGGGNECDSWIRFQFTGAIHPSIHMTVAEKRGALSGGTSEPVYFIRTPIGEADYVRLVQIGMRGGSRYWVASGQDNGMLVKHLDLFALSCVAPGSENDESPEYLPGATEREMQNNGSIFRTEYCVVASQEALRGIAKVAVANSPAATLDWVGK